MKDFYKNDIREKEDTKMIKVVWGEGGEGVWEGERMKVGREADKASRSDF